MRSSKSTEKLEISLKDCAIVFKRCCNYVHYFANLKTLTSLNALNADIAEAPPFEDETTA